METINMNSPLELRGMDEKGMYRVCPECLRKCYYFCYGEGEWACECIRCNNLFSE